MSMRRHSLVNHKFLLLLALSSHHEFDSLNSRNTKHILLIDLHHLPTDRLSEKSPCLLLTEVNILLLLLSSSSLELLSHPAFGGASEYLATKHSPLVYLDANPNL